MATPYLQQQRGFRINVNVSTMWPGKERLFRIHFTKDPVPLYSCSVIESVEAAPGRPEAGRVEVCRYTIKGWHESAEGAMNSLDEELQALAKERLT